MAPILDLWVLSNIDATESNSVASISLSATLLCICIVIGHLLHESQWFNQSVTAIFIGGLTGIIILLLSGGKSSHFLRFNQQLFFVYLLPPIIFNAGFQVKKKQFFHNFPIIMSFGVVGVFISSTVITAGCWWLFPKIGFNGLTPRDYLAIGTIFSSTDTVCTLQVLHQDETPQLYSLVFGEGVVNDATSVVLYNAIQKLNVRHFSGWAPFQVFVHFLYLFSASTFLGVALKVAGLSTAYILRSLYFARHSTDREIALMMLMAYLSYTLAEYLEFSGILTVFFCGIIMSHYAWHNIGENSRTTTRHIFATLSFTGETFIFLYVGMDAFDIEKWKMTGTSVAASLSIYSTIISLVLLGRAAFVFLLSFLCNCLCSREDRDPIQLKHQQIIIWWAGLMRGAVSIALAFKQFTVSGVTWDAGDATMVTSTVIVVLFTTLVFGMATKPLIRYLNQAQTGSQERDPSSPRDDLLDLPLLSIEASATDNLLAAKSSLSLLLERPARTVHFYWRKFDDKYMRPIFGGPGHASTRNVQYKMLL